MSEDLTNKQLLEKVEKAIEAVSVGGQSYKIGSRSVQRAQLSELKNLRTALKAEISSDNETSSLVRDSYTVEFEGR